MITFTIILFLMVLFKLIGLAFSMAWGITKIVASFVFLPLIIVGLILAGCYYLAIPILAVVGIAALVRGRS